MKIYILVLLSIVILISPLSAQTKDPLWDQEQIGNATVLLYQQISDKSAKVGSGTVIVNNGRYYILTASHHAKKLKSDAKVILRLNGDRPDIAALQSISKNHSTKWKHHPVADIALIELDPKSKKDS